MAQKKSLTAAVRKMVAEHTPLQHNRCKAKKCKGTVVKKCIGLFRGQYLYGLPACDHCCRTYLYARGAPRTGTSEFAKSLRRPMTI
jgi:hypothetical protein